MALEERIDHILNLCQAAGQRQQTITDLAARLRDGTMWRSADGKLTIDLAPQQRVQLAQIIQAYTTDLENITAAIRLALQDAPPA